MTSIARKKRVEDWQAGGLSISAFCRSRNLKYYTLPFVYGSRNIWLKDTAPLVPPGTALGKAIHYARNHYTRVIRYLKYPEVTPDNNIAENAIRISGVPQGEAR